MSTFSDFIKAFSHAITATYFIILSFIALIAGITLSHPVITLKTIAYIAIAICSSAIAIPLITVLIRTIIESITRRMRKNGNNPDCR